MRTLLPLQRAVGCAAILMSLTLVEVASAQQTDTNAPQLVERVAAKPRRGEGLGTIIYAPSELERTHFQKLPDDETSTGGLAGEYDIAKKDGKYVGWFGVVREIVEDKAKNRTVLTVEHKYFDGLTDAHILALSFNGSGDFEVVLPRTGHQLKRLSLVKAYGTVKGATPRQLQAVFVRNWEWGAFTFLMAAGQQRGSEQWRKLNKIDLDDIYEPYPDDEYYEARLGKR